MQELLELCAASFAERWTGEVDNLAKTVSIELRELQSAIARSSGRASGEVEALRSEIERGKIQVETLKAEVAELRAELARSQGRRLEAVRSVDAHLDAP